MKKQLKREFEVFIDSFKKIDLRYLKVFFFDLVFIASIVFTFFLLNVFLNYLVEPFKNLNQFDTYAINALNSSLNNFLFFVAISFVLFLVFTFLSFSTIQALIWVSVINKKKISINSIKKFSVLNIILLPIFLFLLFFSLVVFSKMNIGLMSMIHSITQNTFVVLAPTVIFSFFFSIPLIIHVCALLPISYIYLTKTNKILFSIKESFRILVTKIKKLYLPYLLITSFIVLSSLVIWPFKLFQSFYYFLSLAFVLFLITWFRFYIASVIEKIK